MTQTFSDSKLEQHVNELNGTNVFSLKDKFSTLDRINKLNGEITDDEDYYHPCLSSFVFTQKLGVWYPEYIFID